MPTHAQKDCRSPVAAFRSALHNEIVEAGRNDINSAIAPSVFSDAQRTPQRFELLPHWPLPELASPLRCHI